MFSQKLQIFSIGMRTNKTALSKILQIYLCLGQKSQSIELSKKDNESNFAKICQLDKNFNESVCAFIYEGKQDR